MYDFCSSSSGVPTIFYGNKQINIFGNFKLPFGIFQNKFKFWFLVYCTISWSTMNPEKMKSLSEANLRYCIPKTVKSNFYPFICYFTTLPTISLYDICKKMNWPQGDFCSGNISIALCFQIKKIKFQQFGPCGFLCP